jgi:hypothetical protein
MNYTKPNDNNYEDNPKDWLFGALLFTRTLGLIIPVGEGIVVDLKGDMIDLYPNAKRVIVHATGTQIVVEDADDRTDLKEGDKVKMVDEDTIIN